VTEGARGYRRARARDLEAPKRTLTTSERTRSPRALRAPGLTSPVGHRAAHDTHQPPGAARAYSQLARTTRPLNYKEAVTVLSDNHLHPRRHPVNPVKSDHMVDRHQALDAVLGSVRLEDAEPSREVVAALRQWADGGLNADELAVLAARAAAGEPMQARPAA